MLRTLILCSMVSASPAPLPQQDAKEPTQRRSDGKPASDLEKQLEAMQPSGPFPNRRAEVSAAMRVLVLLRALPSGYEKTQINSRSEQQLERDIERFNAALRVALLERDKSVKDLARRIRSKIAKTGDLPAMRTRLRTGVAVTFAIRLHLQVSELSANQREIDRLAKRISVREKLSTRIVGQRVKDLLADSAPNRLAVDSPVLPDDPIPRVHGEEDKRGKNPIGSSQIVFLEPTGARIKWTFGSATLQVPDMLDELAPGEVSHFTIETCPGIPPGLLPIYGCVEVFPTQHSEKYLENNAVPIRLRLSELTSLETVGSATPPNRFQLLYLPRKDASPPSMSVLRLNNDDRLQRRGWPPLLAIVALDRRHPNDPNSAVNEGRSASRNKRVFLQYIRTLLPEKESPQQFLFSPNGRTFATLHYNSKNKTGGPTYALKLWNQQGQSMARAKSIQRYPTVDEAIEFSCDGAFVAVRCWGKQVDVFSLPTLAHVETVPVVQWEVAEQKRKIRILKAWRDQ